MNLRYVTNISLFMGVNEFLQNLIFVRHKLLHNKNYVVILYKNMIEGSEEKYENMEMRG